MTNRGQQTKYFGKDEVADIIFSDWDDLDLLSPYAYTPVLDHGFVRLVEAWGTGDHGHGPEDTPDFECGIIEAARQSTQGSFRGWKKDAKLLRYLYENKHSTPFEFAGMVIEVRAPIFVFREWIRHRTMSYNEMSARYAPLPDLNYLPTVDRILRTTGNKQAGATTGAKKATRKAAEEFIEFRRAEYAKWQTEYERALHDGVPKEIARIGMPVGRYSQMRASTCLRNWLAFLTLRMDPAAQEEIRLYANAVGKIISERFPQTWSLFCDNRKREEE